jgi:nicotinamide phosphoribosyltransferase
MLPWADSLFLLHYCQALEKLLPAIAKEKVNKGGFLVLRPDSGDPIETVLMALR